LSPNDSYARHVVTAVIVAHDGAAWLPNVIDALLGQTRPVQRVVAVDTGSRDRSGAVLTELLGRSVVFGMDRRTGYGHAVSSQFNATWDSLTALEQWAENGVAPANEGDAAAEKLARDHRAQAVYERADLSELAQIEHLIAAASARFGGIDIVVNNAVVRHFASIETLTPAEWEHSLAVNLTAPFLLIQAVLPTSAGKLKSFPIGSRVRTSSITIAGRPSPSCASLRPIFGGAFGP